MTPFREMFGIAGYVIEAAGVISIVVGFILSAIWFVGRLRRLESLDAYQQFRQDLARSIILGLEFLIAGDIIDSLPRVFRHFRKKYGRKNHTRGNRSTRSSRRRN